MIRFKGLSLSMGKTEKALGRLQNQIDSEVSKRLEEYTPVAMSRFPNHGKMSKSHVAERPGIVINTEPKARHEYYTNKGGSGGKRGKHWLERAKADGLGRAILKGLK